MKKAMTKKASGVHEMDTDPKMKGPAFTGPETRTQKRRAPPDSSGLQISDDGYTALPRGDATGVDSRVS